MTRRRWERQNIRNLIRRRGTESASDELSFTAPLMKNRRPRPRQLSKAELRAQSAALVEQWQIQKAPTRLDLKCPRCGRCASVTVELRPGLKLRCSRCGLKDPLIAGRDQLRTWASYRR
jgi:hypothetical protein